MSVAINRIFKKYAIKKEAHNVGQVNVVYVRHIMADPEDIIHNFYFSKVCIRGYVTYENTEQVRITHAKLLRKIACALSCL